LIEWFIGAINIFFVVPCILLVIDVKESFNKSLIVKGYQGTVNADDNGKVIMVANGQPGMILKDNANWLAVFSLFSLLGTSLLFGNLLFCWGV
jgi:hypothetical protein